MPGARHREALSSHIGVARFSLTLWAVQEDVGRLSEISQTRYDPSEHVQEEATREFPKFFPIERNPPIQQVIIKEPCSSSSASTCPRFGIFFAVPVALSTGVHRPSFQ